MAGWVKLHRDIESWEWVDDAFTYWVFTRMILMANYEPKKWHGMEIPRGSFVTSSDNLAAKFKCGRQKIRTVLDRLKSTNEITIKTTSKFSVISIINYEMYNDDNHQTNQQITNNQPATNQQITTTKEIKKIKESKNNNSMSGHPDALLVLDLMNSILGTSFKASKTTMKFINARLNEKFVLNDFETVLRAKHGEWAENAEFRQYLRPQTLFGTKFESYLIAAKNKPKTRQEKLADFFSEHNVQPAQI